MIKPTSLWNFIHECEAEDAEYIGRICLALAGKNVEFTRAEKIQFMSIAKDNKDMDDRIHEQRERWRIQKQEQRGQKKSASVREDKKCPQVSARTKDCPRASDTIRSSAPPLLREELDADAVARARARGKAPTIEEVLRFAADNTHHPDGKAYQDDWARGWYVYMEQSDPPWTKNGSPIGSWRQKMITDWAIHQKEVRNENKGKGEMPVGMVLHQKGYDASKGGI